MTIDMTIDIEHGIADSVAYLGSDAALRSIAIDPYWPKWHSPWWHMLLLFELGEARRIPARVVAAMTAGIDRLLHAFPIAEADAVGVDLHRDIACHCALGTMSQVLAACGVDVARALPWIAPWFARYQMADGGLNCDETAYRVVDSASPSSMVATVAVLEAMLPPRAVVDRAAHCLIERGLVRGSASAHNAEERTAAAAWPAIAFPRFYFYDVLRGLAALAQWSSVTAQPLPRVATTMTAELSARWPDGIVRVERRAFADRMTLLPTADRSPSPRAPAASFPLLEAVSVIGAPSAALTRQWARVRRGAS